MTQRDAWTALFIRALTASHHRDWSEDMITEAAMICADTAIGIIEAMQGSEKSSGDSSQEGYL